MPPRQTERGREAERRIPWRVPKPVLVTSAGLHCCSVWPGPPFLLPPSPWALQEFPSSSHYSEETAGNAPCCCAATADRAETQACDCLCWHRLKYALVVLCRVSFCLLNKRSSHQQRPAKKWVFVPWKNPLVTLSGILGSVSCLPSEVRGVKFSFCGGGSAKACGTPFPQVWVVKANGIDRKQSVSCHSFTAPQ